MIRLAWLLLALIHALPAIALVRPTLLTTCTLKGGVCASASIPSGASTGSAEALELRDRDPKRYRGMGCRIAVRNVNEAVNNATRNRNFESQAELDRLLIALDGTSNKSNLGANAILGASISFARACAKWARSTLDGKGWMFGCRSFFAS